MTGERARFIPDLLQIHIEDLAFLWGQRRSALASQSHTIREYGALNERLEAHLQGLKVADVPALMSMLQPRLAQPDRDDTFAAAYAMLRLNEPTSTHPVIVEFTRASGPALEGLRDALSLAPHELFAAEMHSALEQAKAITAASAAVVLANHRLLDSYSARLAKLIEDPEPAVSELAWRAALSADVTAPKASPERPFKHALADAAPPVRIAAWAAAAWTGQRSLLPVLRRAAATGDAVALHWLSILGAAEDAPLIQKGALAIDDPRVRCKLLSRFGHPAALNALVRWMAGDDVALAHASGEAFTRITGIDIRGERRTLPVPDDADDFTREMTPEVWMPNMKKARTAMEGHGAEWAAGARWCNGHRIDGEVSCEQLGQFDLEARWDIGARAAMAGKPVTAPPPIH